MDSWDQGGFDEEGGVITAHVGWRVPCKHIHRLHVLLVPGQGNQHPQVSLVSTY